MNKEFDCNKCGAPLVEGETKYCTACYSPKTQVTK